MARRCQISGSARQYGHRVSHANNKTKHVFLANIQTKRFYLPAKKRYVTLKVTTRMLRTIDKLGLEGALKRYGLSAEALLQ